MAIKFNELTKIFRQVAERKREPAIDRSHKLYFIPGEYQYIGTAFCFCFLFLFYLTTITILYPTKAYCVSKIYNAARNKSFLQEIPIQNQEEKNQIKSIDNNRTLPNSCFFTRAKGIQYRLTILHE